MKKTFLIAVLCIIIDQIIKTILVNSLEITTSITVIKNFFNITLVFNNGAAFSILKNEKIFLILASLTVIISLIIYLVKHNNIKNIEYILYGVLLGGITGNLIDRIIYSSVVDYLDFTIFKYPFPIFNFADICIVISIFSIVILTFKEEKNAVKSK